MKEKDLQVGDQFSFKDSDFSEHLFEIISMSDGDLTYTSKTLSSGELSRHTTFIASFQEWIRRHLITRIAKPKHQPVYIYSASFALQTNRDIPESLLEKTLDSGECWVRRNVRIWPYKNKLSHHRTSVVNEQFPRETIHTIKWFWESEEE